MHVKKTHVILSLSVCEPVRRTGYVNPKTYQIYVVRNKHSFSKEMIFLKICNFCAAKKPDLKATYFSDLNASIYGPFLYNLSTVLFVPMCFFMPYGQHSLHLIDVRD